MEAENAHSCRQRKEETRVKKMKKERKKKRNLDRKKMNEWKNGNEEEAEIYIDRRAGSWALGLEGGR